jgi:NTP pyrophosphatase (non-canonical NTP hydrolase)
MTFDEYQAEAIKTRKGSADAMYLAAKLPIEAGEAAQHIVKEAYHGKAVDVAQLAEELGDLAWYIANLCDFYGLSFDVIAAQNVAKLRARHGDSYNAAHYQGGAQGGAQDGAQ